MEKSTNRCEVVQIDDVQNHPNADRLDVIRLDNYSVVTGKGNFKIGDLGVYFPPDTIVPELEQFKFLWGEFVPNPLSADYHVPEKKRRIKSKKIRGTISEGLLLPLADFGSDISIDSVNVGDDLAERIGCTHYNPPDPGGDVESAPVRPTKKKRLPRTLRGWIGYLLSFLPGRRKQNQTEEVGAPIPNYDIDAWQKFGKLLNVGEMVWITEKIHGANARYVYMNDRMYAGSHYQWKKYAKDNPFWLVLEQNPWIESFCRMYPKLVLYGELVPTQGTFSYGQKPRHFHLFGFDVYDQITRKFLNTEELQGLHWTYTYEVCDEFVNAGILHDFHWVPTVTIGPYNERTIRDSAVGPSLVPHAGNKREGIIIKTLDGRSDPRFGRVILKLKDPEFKD